MRKPQVLIEALVAVMILISGPIDSARPVVIDPALGLTEITSMKGRVFNSDLNEAIPNAVIILRDLTEEAGFEARTDAHGNYKFPNIAGGVYAISIRVPRSEKIRCPLYLQNGNAFSTVFSKDWFVATIAGFSIKAGKEIVQDFDFACKKNATSVKQQTEAIGPAIKMLALKSVPFDPNLLLDEEWRAKLEPAFAQIPDLQKNVQAASPMKGLYLARTLFLPERIELSGDTAMLVRDFAPVEGKSTIWITGNHRLVILVIGDPSKHEAIPRWTSKFLRVDVSGTCGLSGIPLIFDLNVRCSFEWMQRQVR